MAGSRDCHRSMTMGKRILRRRRRRFSRAGNRRFGAVQEAGMAKPEFEFEESDDRESRIAGTPEGDGDFETDGLPSTGETSAGGQVLPPGNEGRGMPVLKKAESELEKVIDE